MSNKPACAIRLLNYIENPMRLIELLGDHNLPKKSNVSCKNKEHTILCTKPKQYIKCNVI